jgi:hypothetical protein
MFNILLTTTYFLLFGYLVTKSTHLSIAGVNLKINYPDAIILREALPTYETFSYNIDRLPGGIDIDVQLKLSPPPDTQGLTKVFDTGQTWSILRGKEAYFLIFRGATSSQPRWLARFKPESTDITVYCGPELINKQNGTSVISNPVSYPLDQLLMMYTLASREGALIHAAGMDINGRGCIFPGRSGAGKSTLSRQFRNQQGVEIFSDDRMVVRKIDAVFQAFGTPWPGDEKVAVNKSAPLSGIFFIYHAPTNHIKELTPRTALEKLFPLTSIPWYDRQCMPPILSCLEDLVNHIPAFELHFKPTVEVAQFLKEFISNWNR